MQRVRGTCEQQSCSYSLQGIPPASGGPYLCYAKNGGRICFCNLERLKLSLEFRNNAFLLALSAAGMSRCLQRCARGSEPRYLSPDGLPEAPSKYKIHLKSKTPLCLFLPSFPLLSCRLVGFYCLYQPIANQLFLQPVPHLQEDEAALARRASMLMGAQKLNGCPNPAHLAVMTNGILFWNRRRGEKRNGSPY